MDKSWLFVEKSKLGHTFQKKAKVFKIVKDSLMLLLGPNTM